MDNVVLIHHGIKGQRWGVRRFQNEDGTRTAAGKRHDRLMDKADKYDAKVKSEIAKIDSSKTRLGKSYHNTKAYNAQIKSNTLKDRANAKTLTEKYGARFGSGKLASMADATEDFYSRQKEYRKTKLGKHLSSVREYNAHSFGESSEKTYQAKGLVNKGKSIIQGNTTRPIKTLVGRDTVAAERYVDAAVRKMSKNKISVSTIMDIGYVGVKAAKAVKDKMTTDDKDK